MTERERGNTELNRANVELPQENNENMFKGNEWTLPTDIKLVDLAEDEFKKKLTEAGWDNDDENIDMGVAFREVLINAIVHGNLGMKDKSEEESWQQAALKEQENNPSSKSIHVKLDITSASINVIIGDEGDGFDWKNKLHTQIGGPLISSGRGTLLMNAYFDSLEYNEKGNEATLRKNKSSSL